MNNDFFYREWGDTPTIITSDADTNEYHCWIPCQIVAESNRVSENSVFTVNHTSLYFFHTHYCDVVMGVIASQITSLAIVHLTVYSDVDQRKHQSSASLAFVRGIHRWPDEFPAQMASNAENVSIWWRHHVHVFMLWTCDPDENIHRSLI